MSLIDNIKDKIAKTIVNREIKQLNLEQISFTELFKKSFSFFVIMPDEESDFNHSLNVLRALEKDKKSVHILVKDFKVSLLPQPFRGKAIPYGQNDLNKLNLPGKELLKKINQYEYNAILDLNRNLEMFYIYIINSMNAPVKISFKKEDSDKFFNFQIINSSENPEISYKNFVNCLEMF